MVVNLHQKLLKTLQEDNMNLLTVDQASKYLQIHPVTIYRLAKLGQIPSVKFGGSIRIPKDKLDAYQNEDKKD